MMMWFTLFEAAAGFVVCPPLPGELSDPEHPAAIQASISCMRIFIVAMACREQPYDLTTGYVATVGPAKSMLNRDICRFGETTLRSRS